MNKRQKKKQQKKAEKKLLEQNKINIQLEGDEQQGIDLSEDIPQKDGNPVELQKSVTQEVNKEDIEPQKEPLSNEKETLKSEKKSKFGLFGVLYFSLAFLVMEVVMACSTGDNLLSHYGIYMALFSLGYGLLIHVLTTLTKKEKLNRVIQAICLFIASLLFCVIYFLHCEFQLFYNLSTMLAGALDAMGDFSGDIIGMLFTPDGLLHVFLFFLPFIVYLIIAKKLALAKPTNMKTKGIIFAFMIMSYFMGIGGIYMSETDRNMYSKEYNYDSAVSHFGVITGLRLDVKNSIFSKSQDVAFDMGSTTESEMEKDDVNEQEVSTENVTVDNSDEEQLVIPVGKNELDIDFSALAEKDGGQYAAIDEYVASLEASSKNEYTGLFEGKNLIFITAEAFSAEVIDKELTPTLYRLANKGIQFTDFYQPSGAGTTGGEYSNIFGMLPTAGGDSVKKTATHLNWTTIASRLSEEGYYGKAYHNNDYTYYDRDKTHINLGYSDGYEGVGNGLEDIITSQWPESDLEMMEGTLPTYINKEPFNIYYMSVSGHSLYSFGKNAMSRKHQEQVEDLEYSEAVKAYIACQLEFEDAMAYLVEELEQRDMADDTVIVISPDHFPYGLAENTTLAELYGQPVENGFVRDHNRLIIWSGCLEEEEPIVVDTPVSSMDILPTLCNLFGTDYDSRLLPGRDVFSDAEPLVFTLGYDWKTDKGTYIASKGSFTPVKEGDEVSDEYIENIKTIVKNKITYSRSVLQQDYFRHVFEE